MCVPNQDLLGFLSQRQTLFHGCSSPVLCWSLGHVTEQWWMLHDAVWGILLCMQTYPLLSLLVFCSHDLSFLQIIMWISFLIRTLVMSSFLMLHVLVLKCLVCMIIDSTSLSCSSPIREKPRQK